MKPVEELGLLKMDFLGLRNLDVIEDALDIIERSTGERPDMTNAAARRREDLRDARRAATRSACSSSSPRACRRRCSKVKPTEFDDLVALVSLYRPGAMEQIPTYARGKRNPDLVSIADERLEPIIGPTYGVILYQEQAMLISKELAGLQRGAGRRPAQGDRQEEPRGDGQARADVPRGLPRKNGVAQRRPSTGCGRPTRRRADYSFNKSHAACYALIAYRTAWLKANYSAEYMAALISSVMDTKDKVPFFAARCEEMGIEILPPDVNLSDHEFVVVDGNIRFGLDAVKGVGYAAVEAIKRAREEGGAVQVDLGLLRARRPAGASTSARSRR